jgi:hypothetical protein
MKKLQIRRGMLVIGWSTDFSPTPPLVVVLSENWKLLPSRPEMCTAARSIISQMLNGICFRSFSAAASAQTLHSVPLDTGPDFWHLIHITNPPRLRRILIAPVFPPSPDPGCDPPLYHLAMIADGNWAFVHNVIGVRDAGPALSVETIWDATHLRGR